MSYKIIALPLLHETGNSGPTSLRYNAMFIDMFQASISLNIIKTRDAIDCGYNMYILRRICLLMSTLF